MEKEKLSKEQIRDMYGSEYADRFQHEQSDDRIENVLKHVNINHNDVIGDFGCGNAMLLKVLKQEFNAYYGVDFSEQQIEFARLNSTDRDNAQFIIGDIEEFCASKSNFFDKAFALDFTEHMYDEDLVSIFKAIYASLKINGTLIIHTPNAEYFLEIFKEKGIMNQIEGHIGVRSAKEYTQLFNAIGFTTIEVKYLTHYKKLLGAFHFLRHVPIIGRFFDARLLIICTKT